MSDNAPPRLGNNPQTPPEKLPRPEDATNAAAEHRAERAAQDAARDNLARRMVANSAGEVPQKLGR